MKKTTLAVLAALLMAVPLVAANVNGFENFVLSRNDYKSNSSTSIAGFSSRTRTEFVWQLMHFSSYASRGLYIRVR